MTGPLPMTTGRIVALLLGVPLAFALIAWAGLTEVALAGVGSYPVRLAAAVPGSTVRISADAADVQVTQAAGSTLRLAGKARYSLVRSDVTAHTVRSGVVVSSHCHFFVGVCSFNFHAIVPAGKRTVVSDGSGNVTLRDLTGPVVVESGSGNVQANVLTGAVSLHTGSGNITGGALSGPKVRLKADSGDISVDSLASLDVVVTAGSGNIDLAFSQVPASVTVTDSAGNVNVLLPPGPTRYQVDASSSSGNTTVHVPRTTAPGHVITVTDGSGNVSVTN